MSRICHAEKKHPNHYMIGKAAGEHPENVEEEYRRKYYAALDSVITCIKEQSGQEDYEIYAILEQLSIKAMLGESLRKSYKRLAIVAIGFK